MDMNNATPLVGLIMGSRSDWSTLEHAAQTLDSLGVPHGNPGGFGAPDPGPAV